MKYINSVKFFFWKIMYAYYMNKKIRGVRTSIYLAFNTDHCEWYDSSPKDAVDDELSYWGEQI